MIYEIQDDMDSEFRSSILNGDLFNELFIQNHFIVLCNNENKDFCRTAIKMEKGNAKFCKGLTSGDFYSLMKDDPTLIRYIPHQAMSTLIGSTAVIHDGMLLQHIRDQELWVCQCAVKNNPR